MIEENFEQLADTLLPGEERKPVLDPQQWKEFPLIAKVQVSPNTALCVLQCCLSSISN